MQAEEKNVLVTGGAGFIGSHLVDHLLEDGCRVIVLDNFRNGLRENLPDEDDRIRIIHGDITDPETCRQASAGVSVVYHLACLGVRHSIHNPVENHQVNALGTLNLLNAAREVGVDRFVYVSTSEVYGKAEEFPLTEKSTTWPLTVYGGSKLAGEHYSRAFFETYGFPAVCVRPFNNFGPRSHFGGDAGEVIPRFILRALDGARPIIFGDGSQTRDFLYVTDCAEALTRIASCDDLIGEVVNLGYGSEVSVRELAEMVLSASGLDHVEPIYESARPADVPRLFADSTKLRSHIDFSPKVDLVSGVARCFEYFEDLHQSNPLINRTIKHRNWEA